MMTNKLVLLRHGESIWNRENRFTGWTDVDLTEHGVQEAMQAGRTLKDAGFIFDIAYSSLLKRSIRTLWLALDEMDLLWIPVTHSWRLNERHYGALQGLNKAETSAEYGAEQVHVWRRSYATSPPSLTKEDSRYPGLDPRYAELDDKDIPLTECLRDTVARVFPYWQETIAPTMHSGKRVIIAAHGNSIRALVKVLDNVSDDDIAILNIPTGIPLVYEFDDHLNVVRHYYLGDSDELARTTTE